MPMAINKRSILKIDKLTRSVVKRYESSYAAGLAEGMGDRLIYSCAWKKSLSRGRYYYRFEEDYDPDEDFSRCCNKPVVVTDVVSGKSLACPDLHYVSEKLSVPIGTLRTAICTDRNVFGRLKIAYLK